MKYGKIYLLAFCSNLFTSYPRIKTPPTVNVKSRSTSTLGISQTSLYEYKLAVSHVRRPKKAKPPGHAHILRGRDHYRNDLPPDLGLYNLSATLKF
jgi:hypothetical protein